MACEVQMLLQVAPRNLASISALVLRLSEVWGQEGQVASESEGGAEGIRDFQEAILKNALPFSAIIGSFYFTGEIGVSGFGAVRN